MLLVNSKGTRKILLHHYQYMHSCRIVSSNLAINKDKDCMQLIATFQC